MEQVTEGLRCENVTLWIDRIGKSLKQELESLVRMDV